MLQSVELIYPLVVAVAAGIDIVGVVPPLETTGDVDPTDVTFPLRSAESPLIVPTVKVEFVQSVTAEFQRIVWLFAGEVIRTSCSSSSSKPFCGRM